MKNEELCRSIGLLQTACHDYRGQSEEGKSPLELQQRQRGQKIDELVGLILEQYKQEELVDMKAQALISLMDACEICLKESILQQTLFYAEKLLFQMPASPLKCKLLTYCYYYAEDPECAIEAGHILNSWDKQSYNAEMEEAAKCYQDIITHGELVV